MDSKIADNNRSITLSCPTCSGKFCHKVEHVLELYPYHASKWRRYYQFFDVHSECGSSTPLLDGLLKRVDEIMKKGLTPKQETVMTIGEWSQQKGQDEYLESVYQMFSPTEVRFHGN